MNDGKMIKCMLVSLMLLYPVLALHASGAQDAKKGDGPKVYSYVGMNGESHDFEVYFPTKENGSGKAPCAVLLGGIVSALGVEKYELLFLTIGTALTRFFQTLKNCSGGFAVDILQNDFWIRRNGKLFFPSIGGRV